MAAGGNSPLSLLGPSIPTTIDTSLNLVLQNIQLLREMEKKNPAKPATTINFSESTGTYYTYISIQEYSGADFNNVNSLVTSSIGNVAQRGQYSIQKEVVSTNLHNITLPIPLQLVDTNAVRWEEESLNIAGDIAGMAGNAINQVALDGAKVFGSGLVSNIAKVGMSIAGYAPNEFLTMLFKGPTYKRFTLSWKVSPKNLAESEKLNNLILQIKNAQAPSIAAGGFAFKYPKVFFLKLMNKGAENKYLYKFKPAVLETFMVDYAGAGIPGFFRGSGAPESVVLTASFIELEFWLSGDFK